MSTDIGSRWLFKEEWGFEERPSYIDVGLYMKCLLICANGDGRLTQEERDWVVGYFAALGGPDPIVEDLKTYSADEDIDAIVSNSWLDRKQAPRALVFDAIRACCADGVLEEGEREAIHKMAAKVGISAEVVNQLQDVYAEEQRVRKNRIKLAFSDVMPY